MRVYTTKDARKKENGAFPTSNFAGTTKRGTIREIQLRIFLISTVNNIRAEQNFAKRRNGKNWARGFHTSGAASARRDALL